MKTAHIKSSFRTQKKRVEKKKKKLDEKAKVKFKIYDVTDWTTNNCNTYNAQYLKN